MTLVTLSSPLVLPSFEMGTAGFLFEASLADGDENVVADAGDNFILDEPDSFELSPDTLPESVLPDVAYAPSGLHVTLQEGDDVRAVATKFFATRPDIPNARIVFRTEHFKAPFVVSPALGLQLSELANQHGVTLTVFTNSGGYAYEFVPQTLLDEQMAGDPFKASPGDSTVHVTGVDIKKIIVSLKDLFDNWGDFAKILGSFWTKTANFQLPPQFANSQELFSSPSYTLWNSIVFDASQLLQIIIQTKEKYAATQTPEQNTIDKLSLFQYMVSDRLNKVSPTAFALAFKSLLPDSFMSDKPVSARGGSGSGVSFRKFGDKVKAPVPKDPYIGLLEKVPPSTKRLGGLRIDFEPVVLPLPFEIEMLGKYVDYARDPQEAFRDWVRRIPESKKQFTYSLSYFVLAYALFRELMGEAIRIRNQSINIASLNKGFDVLMGLFKEGVRIRIDNELASRGGEQKEFESLSNVMMSYWEEVYNGLLTHFVADQPG